MKMEYESPTFEIDWFEAETSLANLFSKTTDFIPETDSDEDWFE